MKCTNTPRDDESCSFNSNDLLYSDVMQMDPLDGQYPDLDAEGQNILPEHTPSERKYETEYHQHKKAFGMSVFNLANAIMGSGILGLSYAMANAGIIQFVILLILAASFSLYSVHLLLKTANEGGALVYEALGYKAFGMPGKLATSCSITMQNIGAMSSYLYIIKYELPIVIQSFTGASDGEWYINGNYLVLLVSLFVILPLSLLRNLGYLAYSSGLSLLCMVFFLIVVIIKKFQMPCPLPTPDTVNETMHMLNSTPHIDNVTSDDDNDDTCKPKYFVYNSQTVYAIPILTCAFACHPTILPMYEELKDRSRKKMQNVANVSFMAMFSIYLLAALFGYLTFYIHVEPELLHTYSKFYKYDVLLLVVRLAVLAAVTLTVPVVLFPIRTSVNHLLCPTKDFSWIRHIIIAVVLLVGTNTLVIFVPTIRDIFGFIGSSAAPVVIFILPSAFYIKLVKKESMRSMQKIVATMFLIIGFLVMFVCMSLIIHDWSTEDH
ncbi:sodium-coupled neutral amino acid transporter 2-like isoform X1 [Girardinichthys multiradiatus]|uniref:sodium-coupled neutral amino acid transporter 2-like isoform X1 n=1 Tax=Girardinichthys multiradiatus TaxID=208333 RepID=UPI001FADF609|nr:sodium-coupled neutral amino acid transporter 2-like isoform X1 [Girardinichthys multiradiatus]